MKNKIHFCSKILSILFLAALFPITSVYAQNDDGRGFSLDEQVQTPYALKVTLPEFVNALDQMKAPTRYLKEALNSLSVIAFKTFPEGIIASYNKLTNRIDLSVTLKDPATGGLKPIGQLTPDEIATVYHELWHCYLTRVATPRNEELVGYFRETASITYPDHQLDFQDEAYAGFIDTTIATYIQIRRSMEHLTPEKRENVRLQQGRGLSAIYEGTFWYPIYGYYRSWNGKFITTTIDLPKADRTTIARLLYDNQLSMAFAEAFAENKF